MCSGCRPFVIINFNILVATSHDISTKLRETTWLEHHRPPFMLHDFTVQVGGPFVLLKWKFLIVCLFSIQFMLLLLLIFVRGSYKHILQDNLQKHSQDLTSDLMTRYWKRGNRSRKAPWYYICVLCAFFNIRTEASFLQEVNTEFGF
jgi:hypothetical protein